MKKYRKRYLTGRRGFVPLRAGFCLVVILGDFLQNGACLGLETFCGHWRIRINMLDVSFVGRGLLELQAWFGNPVESGLVPPVWPLECPH